MVRVRSLMKEGKQDKVDWMSDCDGEKTAIRDGETSSGSRNQRY